MSNFDVNLALTLAHIAHQHVENGEMRHDVGMALATAAKDHDDHTRCRHIIIDVRNSHIDSGYMCMGCGAVFAAGDHDSPCATPPAVSAEPRTGCMNGTCPHRSDCAVHCSDDPQPCSCGAEPTEKERGDINRFCDANCYPHQHHPKCAYATPTASEQARPVPAEYAGAAATLRQLGYEYQQTDHGMQWVKP